MNKFFEIQNNAKQFNNIVIEPYTFEFYFPDDGVLRLEINNFSNEFKDGLMLNVYESTIYISEGRNINVTIYINGIQIYPNNESLGIFSP